MITKTGHFLVSRGHHKGRPGFWTVEAYADDGSKVASAGLQAGEKTVIDGAGEELRFKEEEGEKNPSLEVCISAVGIRITHLGKPVPVVISHGMPLLTREETKAAYQRGGQWDGKEVERRPAGYRRYEFQ